MNRRSRLLVICAGVACTLTLTALGLWLAAVRVGQDAAGPPARVAPSPEDIVLNYPHHKIKIEGVFEAYHRGKRSLVAWRLLPNDTNPTQLEIHFVNAEPAAIRKVAGLSIAFSLIDPPGPAIPNDPVWSDDFLDVTGAPTGYPQFSRHSESYYDENGAPLPLYPAPNGYRFIYAGLS